MRFYYSDIVKIKKTGQLARIISPAFGEEFLISHYNATINFHPTILYHEDIELYRPGLDI